MFDQLPPPIQVGYTKEALTERFVLIVKLVKTKDWESLEDVYAKFHSIYWGQEVAEEFISFSKKSKLNPLVKQLLSQ